MEAQLHRGKSRLSNLYRFFVGTQSGAIYTHLLDNQEALSEHDALYFVEEVKINSKSLSLQSLISVL